MSTNDLLHPVKVAIVQHMVLHLNTLITGMDVGTIVGAFVEFKCDNDVQRFYESCAHDSTREEFAQVLLLLRALYDRTLLELVHFYRVTEGYDETLSVPRHSVMPTEIEAIESFDGLLSSDIHKKKTIVTSTE